MRVDWSVTSPGQLLAASYFCRICEKIQSGEVDITMATFWVGAVGAASVKPPEASSWKGILGQHVDIKGNLRTPQRQVVIQQTVVDVARYQ